MAQINAYLNLAGKCREAMNFYKECLGGELSFMMVGETPMAKDMPQERHQLILHSSLTNGDRVIFASDMIDGDPVFGNTVQLCLNCISEEEIRTVYNKLAVGGEIHDPLRETFWGAIFGGVIDKFGIRWMFNYDKNQNQ